MAKIDNFDRLSDHLQFDDEHEFYVLEIIKRRKENPEMATGAKVLKHYFLYRGDLAEKREAIIKQCEQENARAYLRLNKRNAKRTALKALQYIANYMETGQYKAAAMAYYSAACDFHHDPRKTWVVDIDDKSILEKAVDMITNLNSIIYIINPTLNGYHIICSGFDRRPFTANFPGVDVHKDNPTVLYY
jgi:hypothetical protein